MVLYLCVLIVFSLRRESLKLILAMNPSPRWFCHTGAAQNCSTVVWEGCWPSAVRSTMVKERIRREVRRAVSERRGGSLGSLVGGARWRRGGWQWGRGPWSSREDPREERGVGVELRQGEQVGKGREWIGTTTEASRTTHRARDFGGILSRSIKCSPWCPHTFR
jgi:hypothetical protein